LSYSGRSTQKLLAGVIKLGEPVRSTLGPRVEMRFSTRLGGSHGNQGRRHVAEEIE